MLEYKYTLFELPTNIRYYLLLPKLNGKQLIILQDRLKKIDFSLGYRRHYIAKKGRVLLHIDPLGICSSSVDPTDFIAPEIPELLSTQKEKVNKSVLEGMYFDIVKRGRKIALRFKTRIEHGYTWSMLRKKSLSGLTPDEYLVITSTLRQCKGKIRTLTNYPEEDFKIRIFGSIQYYDVELPLEEFCSNLAYINSKGRRSCFLPRNNTVYLESIDTKRIGINSKDLGEWCFFET